MKIFAAALTLSLPHVVLAAGSSVYSFECGYPRNAKLLKTATKTLLEYTLVNRNSFQLTPPNHYDDRKHLDDKKLIHSASIGDAAEKGIAELSSLVLQIQNSGHYEDGEMQLCQVTRMLETSKRVTEERFFKTLGVDQMEIIPWEAANDARKQFPELF